MPQRKAVVHLCSQSEELRLCSKTRRNPGPTRCSEERLLEPAAIADV